VRRPDVARRSIGRVCAGIERIWNRIEQAIIGVLGLAALFIGLVQVLGRYVDPARAIGSAEEIIVYLIIWAIMLASSQLVRTDGHVRPDLVLRLMPVRWQRWVEVFNCVTALLFCLGLAWYGKEIVDTALLIDERSSTDLQFPMWIYYLSLPVGGWLMAVRYGVRLGRYVAFFDPATMSIGHAIDAELPSDMRDNVTHASGTHASGTHASGTHASGTGRVVD
jgi:C4-dicarboxylate transporter DctQ subunit